MELQCKYHMSNLWTAELKGKFRALNACIRKEKYLNSII